MTRNQSDFRPKAERNWSPVTVTEPAVAPQHDAARRPPAVGRRGRCARAMSTREQAADLRVGGLDGRRQAPWPSSCGSGWGRWRRRGPRRRGTCRPRSSPPVEEENSVRATTPSGQRGPGRRWRRWRRSVRASSMSAPLQAGAAVDLARGGVAGLGVRRAGSRPRRRSGRRRPGPAARACPAPPPRSPHDAGDSRGHDAPQVLLHREPVDGAQAPSPTAVRSEPAVVADGARPAQPQHLVDVVALGVGVDDGTASGCEVAAHDLGHASTAVAPHPSLARLISHVPSRQRCDPRRLAGLEALAPMTNGDAGRDVRGRPRPGRTRRTSIGSSARCPSSCRRRSGRGSARRSSRGRRRSRGSRTGPCPRPWPQPWPANSTTPRPAWRAARAPSSGGEAAPSARARRLPGGAGRRPRRAAAAATRRRSHRRARTGVADSHGGSPPAVAVAVPARVPAPVRGIRRAPSAGSYPRAPWADVSCGLRPARCAAASGAASPGRRGVPPACSSGPTASSATRSADGVYGSTYFGAGRDPLDRMGLSGYERYDRDTSNADVAAYLLWRHFDVRRSLDVGCAMGFVVEALRELGIDAEGVDVSQYAVEHAALGARGHVRQGNLLRRLPVRRRRLRPGHRARDARAPAARRRARRPRASSAG